jgi:hypothetical protein
MDWAALIVTIFKGSQALRDIYLKSVDLWFAHERAADQDQSIEIQEEREAIVAALKQPGMTDANRRSLRRRLIALSRV